jgi:MSHA pilin protein MshD
MCCNPMNKQQGFTLIEMIIGIVVFAVAMTMITSVILPRAEQSVDPIYQVRAAKLASSLLNEIQGKAFDENSNLSQGLLRCDENSNPCSVILGPEVGENRASFNDVDDYHQFTGSPLDNNQSYDDLYSGYSFVVNVIYDGNYDGTSDSSTNAKLITVSVTMPNSESLNFATYRSNY